MKGFAHFSCFYQCAPTEGNYAQTILVGRTLLADPDSNVQFCIRARLQPCRNCNKMNLGLTGCGKTRFLKKRKKWIAPGCPRNDPRGFANGFHPPISALSPSIRSFSAACKARFLLACSAARLKPCPDTKPSVFDGLSFSHSTAERLYFRELLCSHPYDSWDSCRLSCILCVSPGTLHTPLSAYRA